MEINITTQLYKPLLTDRKSLHIYLYKYTYIVDANKYTHTRYKDKRE